MSGWQFGGWPPPAPAQASFGDSSFRTPTPTLARFVQAIASLPAAGTVTIPSPAPGFVRLVDLINLVSLGATPTYDATLQPSGLHVGGRAISGGAATGQAVIIPPTYPLAFGADESLQISNTGSAAASVIYWYADIPAAGLTLVRQPYGNVGNPAEVVIPAAPAGFYRRSLPLLRQAGATFSGTGVAGIVNDDTAAVVTDWLLASTVIGRNLSLAPAGTAFAGYGAAQLIVTADALSVQAQAAATDATRRPTVVLCYQTIPNEVTS